MVLVYLKELSYLCYKQVLSTKLIPYFLIFKNFDVRMYCLIKYYYNIPANSKYTEFTMALLTSSRLTNDLAYSCEP